MIDLLNTRILSSVRNTLILSLISLALILVAMLFAPSALAADFTAVDTRVNGILDQLNIEGATLIVQDEAGDTIYHKNYGTNFDETTPVTLASASKWLTGATIMTLVEDGLIDLDAPVTDYLSYFEDKGEMSTMTVRQMLAFTTGLPDHANVMDNPIITQNIECRYIANNLDLLFSPGTKFRYGGLQMEIAACVAEAVTGQPYRDIITERLFEPLGMSNSQIANLINRQPKNLDFESANPLTPGGIYTPAEDLIKFVQMILNGGTYNGVRILEEATVDAMKKDQTFDVPINRTIWTGSAAQEWHYSLGNWIQVLDPKTGKSEPEATRVAMSAGALGSVEWVDFDLGYAAVFTTWGKSGQETTDLDSDLVNLVSDAVEDDSSSDPTPDPTPVPTPDPSTKFNLKDRVVTKNITGVWSFAGVTSVLGTQPAGAEGTVVGGPVEGKNFTWWKIDYDNAPDGWSAENWLDKAEYDATPPTEVVIYDGTPPTEEVIYDAQPPISLAPTTKFQTGDRILATENIAVRSSATISSASKLGVQIKGSTGTVVDGPFSAAGYTWWKIDYDNAPDGWSVENWLEKEGTDIPDVTYKFSPNERVVTTDALTVRTAANTASGSRIGSQPKGSEGTVVLGPVVGGGYLWWKIDYDNAPDGWSAENWLTPVIYNAQ